MSDTLPGVAIAISLVPPLANVGILLGASRPDLAWGSLLLFFTNYFAILLTGSFVFGIMGFPKASLQGSTPRIKHAAIAIVVMMIVLVSVPLAYTSYKVVRSNLAETRAADATERWVRGSDYRLVSSKADDARVNVVITGSGRLPSSEFLSSELSGRLLGLAVHVDVLPSTSVDFETQ